MKKESGYRNGFESHITKTLYKFPEHFLPEVLDPCHISLVLNKLRNYVVP